MGFIAEFIRGERVSTLDNFLSARAEVMMSERDDYQFLLDGIPSQFLDEFLLVMLDFQNRTSCRFRYRTGLDEQFPPINVRENLEFIKSNALDFS